MRVQNISIVLLTTITSMALGFGACAPPDAATEEPSSQPAGETVEQSLARLPEDAAGEVIRSALAAAGGLEAWRQLRSVRYLKITTHFDDAGQVEGVTEQLHTYRLQPTLGVRIEYEDDETGGQVLLLRDGEQAWKLLDGSEQTGEDDRNQAFNSTAGSHYVFAQPFKLVDPGTHHEDLGESELADGTRAHGVRITYDPSAGSAGGMHTWTYWFGVEDHRLAANLIVFGDGENDASYTEYEGFVEIEGLLLGTGRVSYQSNQEGERLDKTTAYENRDIELDVEVSDEWFRPPG